jgi:uncharacterized protein (TIGR02687 family)
MSPLDSIERQLRYRFSQPGDAGRLVFWSDPDGEYADSLDSLSLPGVTVVRVQRNDFQVKHRVLKAEPKGKFLLYRAGPAPATLDDWLLDLELAYGVFTADKTSLVLQVLVDVEARLKLVVDDHPAFFRSAKRTEALKARLEAGDRPDVVMAKMVAVLIGSDHHSLDLIWRTLLEEHAAGKTTGIDEITKLGLADFHWQGTQRIYRYESAEPTVADFVLWLFERAWSRFASDVPGEFGNVQRDFSHWANDWQFLGSFRRLADEAASALRIGDRVAGLEVAELMDRFTFSEIDRQIVARLAAGVDARTVMDRRVQEVIRRRGAGTWFADFKHTYTAIGAASAMLARIDGLSLHMASPADGFNRYANEWFAVDQAYRHFVSHAKQAEVPEALEGLASKVEGFYSTRYLTPLGTAWQSQVDSLDAWKVAGLEAQAGFFAKHVQPVLGRGNKLVVVVSDALRYEAAEELGSLIRAEDRFEAALKPLWGVLPSFTQLGMAALLPHTTLDLAEDGLALVDGQPSDGTANRSKLLAAHGGVAIQETEFMALTPAQARDLVKAHQVVYVYHNQIDKAGDDRVAETRVFRAVEETFSELVLLVKKLANANVSNILITADHGFLYQDGGLDESGYLSVKPHGDRITVGNNRRFVLGYGLKRDQAFTTYTASSLGLAGDIEAQVPKSVNRLRVAGSGTRYVHGGASLQEIVVPVLAVNKKRSSDVRTVAVRILQKTDKITTGQIAVDLFQEEPVTEKVKPVTLAAGLWAGDTLISNEVPIQFSHTSPDARERYATARLALTSDADDFNGQAVELRLMETIPGTQQRRAYHDATARFTLVRTFGSDFDF